MFSRSVSNQCNEKSLPLNNIPISQKRQPPTSSVSSDINEGIDTRCGGEDLRRVLALPSDLRGWGGMFIRQLQRQARISRRDGKAFKLSQWQLGRLEKVEAVEEVAK